LCPNNRRQCRLNRHEFSVICLARSESHECNHTQIATAEFDWFLPQVAPVVLVSIRTVQVEFLFNHKTT
uniref:Phlebovirus_G2 domain-containing protein n=1 Tax=Haemonchus placei TaxID=6290 RepID=A0A0N4WJ29_HAEPC